MNAMMLTVIITTFIIVNTFTVSTSLGNKFKRIAGTCFFHRRPV